MTIIPSLITSLGLLVGLWYFNGGPWWAALLSLACDVADGWVARRLDACTEFGSLYDWIVDVILACLSLRVLGQPRRPSALAQVGRGSCARRSSA